MFDISVISTLWCFHQQGRGRGRGEVKTQGMFFLPIMITSDTVFYSLATLFFRLLVATVLTFCLLRILPHLALPRLAWLVNVSVGNKLLFNIYIYILNPRLLLFIMLNTQP